MDAGPPRDDIRRPDTSFRLPAWRVGDRVVVRHRLPDGSATDVIGWLEEGSAPGEIALRDARGRLLRVQRRLVVAARVVPPARRGRDPLRTTPAELEQLAVAGWAADREPLGEWTLRAGGGFTGRANSCLAVGDPGVPLGDAAARIVSFAAERGARPWAQVVTGSAEDQGLSALGWVEVYVPTDVLVTRLGDLLERTAAGPAVGVAEELTPAWLRAYERSRPGPADPAVVRRILDGVPPRAFAGVAEGDELVAIGRGHRAQDWLGLASLWTAPAHRRRGWAGSIVHALGQWAARGGARSVYLQVASANEPARGAYARLGFRLHHRYHYLGPGPDVSSAARA